MWLAYLELNHCQEMAAISIGSSSEREKLTWRKMVELKYT